MAHPECTKLPRVMYKIVSGKCPPGQPDRFPEWYVEGYPSNGSEHIQSCWFWFELGFEECVICRNTINFGEVQ